MNYPKISLITPSFNQGEFIEDTITSVLNQNYPNLEYIIIDGGSTDKTLSILKKFENKIRWISEKDKGQADALNKGFKLITGDIVGYLCSDDLHLPHTLATIAKFFNKNTNANLVSGDYYIINSRGEKIHSIVSIYKKLYWKIKSYTTFQFINYVNQPATFWKKDLFKKYGYFNINLKYTFDYDWWLKVNKDNEIYFINKPMAKFRIHPNSKSGAMYINALKEDYYVTSKYTKNLILLSMKKVHNKLITEIYRHIRY